MGGGRAGSLLLHRCALVVVSGAHSLVVVPGLPVAAASLVMEHRPQGPQALVVAEGGLSGCGPRLWSTGSMVVVHRLSSSEGTWDLPGPGIELMSPALAGFFTTSHYGNSTNS